MRFLRLISEFIKVSLKEESAYRVNFAISLLTSLLTVASAALGIAVVFGQTEDVQGWTYASTLVVLGVYLMVNALRGLFISPGLESLAGMDGEVWSGRFDFSLLRPVDTQFLVTFRKWRLFSLIDLLFGIVVTGIAIFRMHAAVSLWQILLFGVLLCSGTVMLYAILLIFSAMVFWSPGVLYTWVFNGLFQLARYPLSMYPGWLRFILTWIIPVGIITTFPVQALTGELSMKILFIGIGLAIALVILVSWLFRRALTHYSSASS
jgi:ABC-2 type transport system permease protein